MADPRACAARCLAAVSERGISLSRQLPLDEARLKSGDRPLYREFCYGTLRYYHRLQGLLRPLIKKPLRGKDADVRMLLCLGLYQLDYMRIPAHAAINNTVGATAALGKPWARGLVNAVLRRYQREEETLKAQLTEAERAAHPEWLLTALQSAWPTRYDSIIEANNAHPPMCLRVSAKHHPREDYLALLAKENIEATPCAIAESGVRLAQPMAVESLPGFADGHVSVQDEAAQLVREATGDPG